MPFNEEIDLEVKEADLQTKDGAIKAIRQIVDAAKDLRKRNGALESKISELSSDLTKAQQALSELQRAPLDSHDSDSLALKQFVHGNQIQFVGKYDEANGWMPGLFDMPEKADGTVGNPYNEWHADVLRAVNDYSLLTQIMSRPGVRVVPKRARARLLHLLKTGPSFVQRVFSDVSTSGAEWIPDITLPMFEKQLRQELRVESLFQHIPVSTQTVKLPYLSGGARPYISGVITTDDPAMFTASSISTTDRTIDQVTMAVRTIISDEAQEDALFDMLPLLSQELVMSMLDGSEDALINGDTTATHQDTIASWNTRSLWGASGLGGSSDHRRSQMGLRAHAVDISNATDRSATQTYAGFLAGRATLKAPCSNMQQLACIVSPEHFLAKIVQYDQVATVDKMGDLAAVIAPPGRMQPIAFIAGEPIYLSEFMTPDLNASGLFDNVTLDYTGMLHVQTSRFKVFERRGNRTEIVRDGTRGINHVVVTRRFCFKAIGGTEKAVEYSYKLAK
jgi:HK97 family phage major capsid protein